MVEARPFILVKKAKDRNDHCNTPVNCVISYCCSFFPLIIIIIIIKLYLIFIAMKRSCFSKQRRLAMITVINQLIPFLFSFLSTITIIIHFSTHRCETSYLNLTDLLCESNSSEVFLSFAMETAPENEPRCL